MFFANLLNKTKTFKKANKKEICFFSPESEDLLLKIEKHKDYYKFSTEIKDFKEIKNNLWYVLRKSSFSQANVILLSK